MPESLPATGKRAVVAWPAAVLALAGVLRVVRLGEVPPAPGLDEAANVIEARCLSQTGRDSKAEPWPLFLKGAGDYRDATFTYLAVPALKLAPASNPVLGPRALAALAGMAGVFFTYLFGARLFGPRAGLWSALFLAIDPQHVIWSRLGMENVLGPTAAALALLAYERCERRPRGGAAALALAMLAVVYHGPLGKPLAGLLTLAFLADPGPLRACWNDRRTWPILGTLVLAVGCLPAAIAVAQGTAGVARFQDVAARGSSAADWVRTVAANYLGYLSPRYLIFPHGEGAPDLPLAGKMGYAEFACLIAGAVWLLTSRPKFWRLLLVALVLAPLPASLTDSVAPSRLLIALPVATIVAGYGASRLTEGRRGAWAAGALLAVAGVTIGLILTDVLTDSTNRHLDAFFHGPTRRAVSAAIDLAGDRGAIAIDPDLPFAHTFYIYLADPPAPEIQRYYQTKRSARRPIGRAVIAPWRALPDWALGLRTIFLVPGPGPVPRARLIGREGDVSIWERGP